MNKYLIDKPKTLLKFFKNADIITIHNMVKNELPYDHCFDII